MFIILAGIAVEKLEKRSFELLVIVISVIFSGISFIGISSITNRSAIYLGSASIAMSMFGQLVYKGFYGKAIRNWSIYRKIIFGMAIIFFLIQILSMFLRRNTDKIPMRVSFLFGIIIPLCKFGLDKLKGGKLRT